MKFIATVFILLFMLVVGCAGEAADECIAVPAVPYVVCSDPVQQGWFSSGSCYTAEEMEEILDNRSRAFAEGDCVVPRYFRYAEARPAKRLMIVDGGYLE